MIGGILFFVVEKKHSGYEGEESFKQLFLELLCKHEFLFLT